MTPISSAKNPVVARFRDAAAGRRPDLLVADGVRPVEEALDAGLELVEVLVSPRLDAAVRGTALRVRLDPATRRECADAVLERVSQLSTHQGVAAIVRRPVWEPDDLLAAAPALVLVAAGVRDPGNLGALLRTAEAAGATGVVTLAGGADPFRDKAVRGSAGSVFRVPLLAGREPAEVAGWLRGAGVPLLLADARGERDYVDHDFRSPCAIAVGGEASGAPAPLAAAATVRLAVPMGGCAESLNVAVAAGVLLYEARRQRR